MLKIHRSWLTAKLGSLEEAQGRAGEGKAMDKSTVGRCRGMRNQIYGEFGALERAVHSSWRAEMVRAGLFGPTYYGGGKLVEGAILSPIEMDTG